MSTRKIEVFFVPSDGNSYSMEVPAKRTVCPRCEGTGTHVNPSIDGHGLTQEDFDADPDFAEGYFNGRYDVRCEECDGRNVVEVPDLSRLTAEEREDYYRAQDEEAAARREADWEARWCV
jgi:RecJ-like exonuclease